MKQTKPLKRPRPKRPSPPTPPTPSADWTTYRADRRRYTHFGDSPWETEPDRDLWTTHAGLPGAILRHPDNGHLCGYVAVPRGHVAYGASTKAILDDKLPGRVGSVSEITFARGVVDPLGAAYKKSRDPDWWWLGFDGSHAGNAAPSDLWVIPETVYRRWDDVLAMVERLAKELAAIGPRSRPSRSAKRARSPS